ncbi:MAG: hypothetical protein ABIE23_01925, partial [archaeon]
MIEKVEVEKSYKINNGYTSLFKNSLRMNIGRYGELTDSEEEISEVNKDNNVSEKEFEQRRRFGGNRNRFGGNRSFDRSPKRESKEASDDSDSSDSDFESDSDSDDSDE